MKKTLFGIILALSINLLACAEDGKSCTVIQNADSATITCEDATTATISTQECAIPPSTLMMQHSWAEATYYRLVCNNNVDDLMHVCNEHSEDAPGGLSACMEGYYDESAACDYYFAMRVNKFTIRECGVEIIEMLTPFEEYDPRDETQRLWKVDLEGDYDGDGISNYREYFMGYNPCTPQSFGCVNDADLDYDVDGIPNGEDYDPICNWDDPAGWEGDCI